MREPKDYIFFRKNPSESNRSSKEVVPAHQFSYKEAHEVLAASVKNVDRSIVRLCQGNQIKTRWGLWWAELKYVPEEVYRGQGYR